MNKLSFLAGSITLLGRNQRRENRDASSLLNRYDDRMLEDIGLSRGDQGLIRRR